MYDKINLDDFLKNHNLTNLKINKAENYGLYFDYTQDHGNNVYCKDVFLIKLRGFEIKRLNLPFEPDDFLFLDDVIIFKLLSFDNTTFYSYNLIDDSTIEKITIPFVVKKFAFSESKLFFTMEVQKSCTGAAVQCSHRGPFYQEGRGIVGDGIIGLFQSDLNGKEITMVSSLDMDIDRIDFDFNNNRIVFTAYAVKKLRPVTLSVYLYNIDSDSLKLLNDDPFRISYIKSMTEDTIVFFGVDLKINSRNDNPQIYKINTLTGEFGLLGKLPDKSNEYPSVVTDSFFSTSLSVQKYNDLLYFKLVERDGDILYKISLDGDYNPIETGLKTIGCFCVIDSGVVLIGLKDLKLSEIYFSDNLETRQVSHHNRWLDELVVSKAEKMSVLVDDVEIDGYVFPPVDVVESQLYPAVLFIHGGPKMLYTDIFSHDIQLLCANGYYVFCANPMGSDGRGNSFANIRGRFGQLPFKQLMAFTDKVLEKYHTINGESLGVTGGSYGGYMTNYVISHTHRFKAAVSERGISSLMTSFTSSDIGYQYVYEYMGNKATPWTDPEVLIEESPIFQAHRVKTPTLFIHGENDYRCHYSESVNMFGALNYHGVETKLCLFKGESHGLTVRGKPQNKNRRYLELLSWFDKFLKGE